MLRVPNKPVPHSVSNKGRLVSLKLPYKGIDAQVPFAAMTPEWAIAATNVIVEAFGLRTRRGWTEWAVNLPSTSPIYTLMSYFQAGTSLPFGELFASQDGSLYDITNGGIGPWEAQEGVQGTSDWWNSLNLQNAAGAFLCVTNEEGGYWYYDGAAWTQPVQGVAAGEIDGANPDLFANIATWKKRLWFAEKNSTRAWYLPVDQITGKVTLFDFGTQFPHGGYLVGIYSWTVDGGDGMDDHLVAVSSQGDVVIYKGIDPDTAETFVKHGQWYVGPLPTGRRQVQAHGGDVYILSQLGVRPVSKLLQATSLSAEQEHVSRPIDPLIAILMRSFAQFQGWTLQVLSKEELMLVGIPAEASPVEGPRYFAYKLTNPSWSILTYTTYTTLIGMGQVSFAGLSDGRIAKAFDGLLDDVRIGENTGKLIPCTVAPAYQPCGEEGLQKRFLLARPVFITRLTPLLTLKVLTDYAVPRLPVVPTLPNFGGSRWDEAVWNVGSWAGVQKPIQRWLGVEGQGFVGTLQLDYAAAGETLLMNNDFWVEQGGVL